MSLKEGQLPVNAGNGFRDDVGQGAGCVDALLVRLVGTFLQLGNHKENHRIDNE